MYYGAIEGRNTPGDKLARRRRKKMDENGMTHTEFMAYLETLAQLIEAKAETKDEAVEIIRDLVKKLK